MKDFNRLPNRYIDSNFYYYQPGRRSTYSLYQDFRIPEDFTRFISHTIANGETVQSISRKYYACAEMFFVIIDANQEIEDPWDLSELVGKTIKILFIS